MNILIVDDERIELTSIRRILKRRGFKNVEICDSGEEAIRMIRENDFDLVLLDIIMPGVDGLQVLKAVKPFKPFTEFIIISAIEEVSTTVKALRLGAYDYLLKPLETDRLVLSIKQAFERKGLRVCLSGSSLESDVSHIPASFSHIVTRSLCMKKLILYTENMARSGIPIIITGESGTGKELFAKGIHRAGPGSAKPFVPVNVASVPETLFESQFFGHTNGAFTGSNSEHKGYFEQAEGGILFLDEIGDLPHDCQAKLLRALETKEIVRIGEQKPRPVEIQIVSSTNADLYKACQEGRFRIDLLYRLNSVHIHLPPLRERLEDIPLLVNYFIEKSCRHHNLNIQGISPEALSILCQYGYPGNIRELAQIIDRAAAIACPGTIQDSHINMPFQNELAPSQKLCNLKENSEIHVTKVLAYTQGDRKLAAKILGISVRSIQRKLAQKKINLNRMNTIADW